MFPVENFAYNGIQTSKTIPVPTYHDMKLYREGNLHFNATWRRVAEFPICLPYSPRKWCPFLNGQGDRERVSYLRWKWWRKEKSLPLPGIKHCWCHNQSLSQL